jgi:hypothetical protein
MATTITVPRDDVDWAIFSGLDATRTLTMTYAITGFAYKLYVFGLDSMTLLDTWDAVVSAVDKTAVFTIPDDDQTKIPVVTGDRETRYGYNIIETTSGGTKNLAVAGVLVVKKTVTA